MENNRKWAVNWTSNSDAEAAAKLTLSILLAFIAYIYHLGGWTMTVHFKGEVILEIPELW